MGGAGQLSEGQLQLFFLVQSWLLGGRPDGSPPLVDGDVADAAGAVAASLETASRGVVYEHPAQTASGQRLASQLRQVLAEAGKGGGSRFEREAAVVLRAIAAGAGATADGRGSSTAYLDLVARVLREGAIDEPPAAEPTIILP